MLLYLLPHTVHKRADICDRNPDFVVRVKRKRIRRNDTGAGQEETAIWKTVIAVKVLDQRRRVALHGIERCRTREFRVRAAHDFQRDLSGGWHGLLRHEHTRTQRAASV